MSASCPEADIFIRKTQVLQQKLYKKAIYFWFQM
jgi:hypothetical protein